MILNSVLRNVGKSVVTSCCLSPLKPISLPVSSNFCPTMIVSVDQRQARFFSNLKPDPEVVHNTTDKIFSLTYPGHDSAHLRYRHMDSETVDMFSTVVPPSLGGRGMAKILANNAFDWAVENNLKMRLSCWYLSGYLKRNPRDDVLNLVI